MKTETVTVGLDNRSYDIIIGPQLIAKAGALIAKRLPNARAGIVTDSNVGALHLPALEASLKAAGIASTAIIVEAGEQSKNFSTLETVVDRLLAAKLERGDIVIAFGGGVVGDLAGFAAGIVRRGMEFVQIPTSLLAQVDSSVGGKTGINTVHGKNLLGVFYQPKLVLADTDILKTLPIREFRAGYAEMVKYGLINSSDFFHWLEKNRQAVFAGGQAQIKAIAAACRAKAEVVERDEVEHGERALLNLGHTFGHALETATGYNAARLVHGEGVAIGMVLAYQFSAWLKLCPAQAAKQVEAHLRAAGLPTQISDISGSLPDVDTLMGYIAQDKKVSNGALTFILTRGIGKAFIAKDIPATQVRTFLTEKLGPKRV